MCEQVKVYDNAVVSLVGTSNQKNINTGLSEIDKVF